MKYVWEQIKIAAAWFGPRRVAWFLAWFLTVIGSCMGGRTYLPLPPEDCPQREVRSYGWIDAPELGDPVNRRNRWPFFRDMPAGKARFDDGQNVGLWKALERVAPSYQFLDQGQVGCCVGCGTKHAADATAACEIALNNQPEAFKPLSAEAIYAAGRVYVGNGQINGDGSLGSWSAEACTKYGFCPMEKIGDTDLSTFSNTRAREWGRRGVPDAVKEEMAKHKMGSAARVTSWPECKQALAQGYAVFVCSNVGFEGRKDSAGFIRASGTWPHCMAILGYQVGQREGGLICNSWGTQAHAGPRGWGDPPDGCSFWADSRTIDRMLKQGDSFALSKFDGFPARQIDWWAGVPGKSRWLAIRNRPELSLK